MSHSVFRCAFRVAIFSFVLVVFAAVLSTGSVAADGDFTVEIQPATPDSVDENENLDVTIIVTNKGDKNSTQTISLEEGDGT